MSFSSKLKLLIARADDGDTEAMDEFQVLVTSNADNLVALVESVDILLPTLQRVAFELLTNKSLQLETDGKLLTAKTEMLRAALTALNKDI